MKGLCRLIRFDIADQLFFIQNTEANTMPVDISKYPSVYFILGRIHIKRRIHFLSIDSPWRPWGKRMIYESKPLEAPRNDTTFGILNIRCKVNVYANSFSSKILKHTVCYNHKIYFWKHPHFKHTFVKSQSFTSICYHKNIHTYTQHYVFRWYTTIHWSVFCLMSSVTSIVRVHVLYHTSCSTC